MNRLNKSKSLNEIAQEWDNVCERRNDIIEAGQDFSLTGVTSPCIIQNITQHSKCNILDIGCGTGYLSNLLCEHSNAVVAIDISPKSIEIASHRYERENLLFLSSSVQDFEPQIPIDICVANMVLMTEPDVVSLLKSVHRILEKNGRFIFIITHPCFWPKYWGYDDASWFSYSEEICIQNEFATSLSSKLGITTHIHRPLEYYTSAIIDQGFVIESVQEPRPSEVPPENYHFDYPRFLCICCKKQ